MPRIKIDYIVSFSSEDPEHPASNLLSLEINKKKWLCKPGETSCSIVFQLTKAVEISSVHIGGSQVALVEVLVGRSETPSEPFQVLVPSSVFLSPSESRRGGEAAAGGAGSERVRTFAGEQLAARGKFDRVRVVCSQPYNKHCKFGLSFIHIYEPESLDRVSHKPEVTASDSIPQPVSTSKPAANSSLVFESEDEEDFKPGELFAKHIQKTSQSTDAQIRQASSHALKNISDSSTKLTKTSIIKQYNRRPDNKDVAATSRQRDDLMYVDDDERPHAKIDRIVNRHKVEKSKENVSKKDERDKKYKENSQIKERNEVKKDMHRSEDGRNSEVNNGNANRTKKRDEVSSSQRSERDSKKRPHSAGEQDSGLEMGPECSPERVLSGVTFALSGYDNPQRGHTRRVACSLGARYVRDWSPQCTHLICAFPNTPKLRAARASGAACVAVTAEWVHECLRTRRRLPAAWYATTRHSTPLHAAAECDTDDEIEQVIQKQKKQKTDKSPTRVSCHSPTRRDNSPTRRDNSPTRRDNSPPTRVPKSPSHTSDKKQSKREHKPPTTVASPDSDRTLSPPRDVTTREMSRDSDVTFVKDERYQGNITVASSDSDTETDTPARHTERVAPDKCLPELFRDVTFLVDASVTPQYDVTLLERYIQAYGGLVLHDSQLDTDSVVDYVICTEVPSPRRACVAALPPAWLWRCHQHKLVVDIAQYKL